MRTKVSMGVAAIVGALLMAACSETQPQNGPSGMTPKNSSYLARPAQVSTAKAGTLHLQVVQDVTEAAGLDPSLSTKAASWQLESLVYQTLVGMSPSLKPVPELAESWDRPDPRTYVFHLRRGVKFSNGRAMTASDVVGSLKRLMNPKTGAFWASQLGPVKDVVADDDDTVRVTLKRPYSPFLASLANISAAILPMKEIKAKTINISKQMLGTGPYAVASHKQDTSWMLTRNRHYWQAHQPRYDTISIAVLPQDSSRVAALRDGSTDIATMTSVDTPRVLQGQQDVKAGVQQTTDFWYLLMNSQWPGSKLRDQRVRQAINMTVDRSQIAKVAQAGLAKPTADSPAAFGACDPAQLPSAKGNVRQAKKLLKEAGASDLTFTLMTYNSDPQIAQIGQVIQQQLRAIGVTMKIKTVDSGAYHKSVYTTHHFDAAVDWYSGYGDPAMVIKWWNPQTATFNKGIIKDDPTVNKAIAAAQRDSGAAKTADLRTFCAAADTNSDMVALTTRPAIVAWRSDTVQPTFYRTEGYSDLWRNIATFQPTRKAAK